MSNNALAVRDPGGEIREYEQAALTEFGWQRDDVRLVREMIAKDATDAEYRTMLYMARTYKLDPLLKQIWLVKYSQSKPAQIFVARDGYIAIGHRLGVLNGMQSGARIEKVPFTVTYRQDNQTKTFTREWQYVGWARVWIKGAEYPFEVEVWEEEYSTGRDNWVSKPRTQITKVAESQALRRGVSISGFYEPAEIGEETEHVTGVVTVEPSRVKRLAAREEGAGAVVNSTARVVDEPPANGNGKHEAEQTGSGSRKVVPRAIKEQRARFIGHCRSIGMGDEDTALLFKALSGGKAAEDLTVEEITALAERVSANFPSSDHFAEWRRRHQEREEQVEATKEDNSPATAEQTAALREWVEQLGWEDEQVGWFLGHWGTETYEELTVAQAAEAIRDLEDRLPVKNRQAEIAAATARLATSKRM